MAKRFCSSLVRGALGAIFTVPSQARPANPVPTLSRTPSRTEVITTSAKTPSIRRVRVSAERSLWAQSSTKLPRTISHPRASQASGDRDGSESWRALLIAERLHRAQARRAPGREQREDESEHRREQVRVDEAHRVHVQRNVDDRRDDPG